MRLPLLAAALALAACALAPGPAGAAVNPCGKLAGRYSSAAPPAYRHVVVIMDENTSEPTVIGSPAAPFLTGLARACGLATQYHGATHPSQPNYLALASGRFPAFTGGPQHSPADNLFHQAQAAGDAWRSYQESMTAPCNAPAAPLPYYKGHDPAQWFTDLRGAGAADTCARFDLRLRSLAATLAADTGPHPVDRLPRLAWVTPDECHDMHWTPVCQSRYGEAMSDRVAFGDRWLASLVPRLRATDAYQKGRMLILITWDEGNAAAGSHGSGPNADCTRAAVYTADAACRVALIAVSPYIPAGRRSADPAFNHYATTRTIEDILGYPPLARAATSPDMRSALHF